MKLICEFLSDRGYVPHVKFIITVNIRIIFEGLGDTQSVPK